MKYQSTSKPDLIRQTEQLLCNGKTGREQPHWLLIAIVTTCCALAGSVFGASLVATVELSALDGSNGFIINGKETHGSGSSVSSVGDVNVWAMCLWVPPTPPPTVSHPDRAT